MTSHTIRRGFDIRIAGRAEAVLADAPEPKLVALDTAEFAGLKAKALVEQGNTVATGQPLFLDKFDRSVVFCSPATGVVTRVEYGERHHLQRVVVEVRGPDRFHPLPAVATAAARDEIVAALAGAGLWPLLRQRPLGKVPRTAVVPAAIFVNGMDTAPLAACPAFATQGAGRDLQAGIDLLQRLTPGGKVYLCLRAGGEQQQHLRALRNVEVHEFAGPHPAGLVGTHIARVRPLKTGEVVFTLRAGDVARIGAWLGTGRYPHRQVVAVAGSAAPAARYFRVRQGAQLAVLTGGKPLAGDVRLINGTVLDGTKVAADGCLGFHATTLTIIPEGTDQRDLFGWALPQFGKLSFHRSVFSWLLPKKDHVVDARLHGGHRPIVNIGSWERVVPLDIHPSYLVRAIQAGDIEEAVKLGLLEVIEEDVALCTFVDPCKIDVGAIVRSGLDQFEKEG